MFITSAASNIWSPATTALGTPTAATAPISQPTTPANGSAPANNPIGSSNPFQALSADLQSWLTQNQASSGAQTQAQQQVQPHHHHHHRGGDALEQADQSDPSSSTDPLASTATA